MVDHLKEIFEDLDNVEDDASKNANSEAQLEGDDTPIESGESDAGGDTPGADGEVSGDKSTTTEDTTDEEVKPEEGTSLTELHRMIREQSKLIRDLKAKYETTDKVLKDHNLVEEEEVDAGAAEIATVRQMQLDTILETMRLNSKYEDIDTVVSQKNFDETITLMARDYVGKHGGNLNEVIEGFEQYIWSQTNPYLLMYNKVKEIHPLFREAKAQTAKPTLEQRKELDPLKKDKKIAPTIADLGGEAKTGGTWTTERIDAMSETELDKIPPDIYNRYMRGELP